MYKHNLPHLSVKHILKVFSMVADKFKANTFVKNQAFSVNIKNADLKPALHSKLI